MIDYLLKLPSRVPLAKAAHGAFSKKTKKVMKFTFNSAAMAHALSLVMCSIDRKPNIQILASALVTVGQGDHLLRLTAGNSDTTVTVTVSDTPAEVSDDFRPVCIDPHRLAALLANIGQQPVTADTDTDTCITTYTYADGSLSLQSSTADEYPTQPPVSDDCTSIDFDGTLLASVLSDALQCAAGKNELRTQMQSVALVIEQERFTFAASNGHALYRFRRAVPQPLLASTAAPRTVIIPTSAVRTLIPLVRMHPTVTIKADDTRLTVTTPSDTLTATQCQGRYPNFDSVFPDATAYHITLSRADLAAAIRRASVAFMGDRIVCLYRADDNFIDIVSSDTGYNTRSQQRLHTDGDTDPDNSLIGAFTAETLALATTTLHTDEIRLDYNNCRMQFVATEIPHSEASTLLMPVMTYDEQ